MSKETSVQVDDTNEPNTPESIPKSTRLSGIAYQKDLDDNGNSTNEAEGSSTNSLLLQNEQGESEEEEEDRDDENLIEIEILLNDEVVFHYHGTWNEGIIGCGHKLWAQRDKILFKVVDGKWVKTNAVSNIEENFTVLND